MPAPEIATVHIESRIHVFRGQKVILDRDLAELYDVPTHRLNEQVSRNIGRFPDDFMFRLSPDEADSLRSQIAILKERGQHSKFRPRAFTEHGILMLSSVLRSARAIQVNIAIMRAFVRLRRLSAANEELAARIAEIERKYDAQFKVVFDAIRELMKPPTPTQGRIGFRPSED